MEDKELINAQILTAKTKGKYSVKPLQLPEEPKRPKLDKTEPLTKVELGQPSDVPKAPKRIKQGSKLDWQKNTMLTSRVAEYTAIDNKTVKINVCDQITKSEVLGPECSEY